VAIVQKDTWSTIGVPSYMEKWRYVFSYI